MDEPGAEPLPDRPPVVALSTGALRVPSQAAYLTLVGMVVRWFGHRAGLSDEKCQELEVAVDEACTNVIIHANRDGEAQEMAIHCTPIEQGLQVTIADHGAPFTPEQGLQIADQKHSRNPASGGMGLRMVQQLTDVMHHQWDQQQGNRLTLIKHK